LRVGEYAKQITSKKQTANILSPTCGKHGYKYACVGAQGKPVGVVRGTKEWGLKKGHVM
jgi:hypothetical protein